MCRHCKDISNIRERIAAHDWAEQLRAFYGLEPLHRKDRRFKNLKKSILAKIDHNLQQLQTKPANQKYANVAQRLTVLRDSTFDARSTPEQYASIMDEYYEAQRAEILAYLRAEGYSDNG